MKTLPLLIFCVASISFAEDFKTLDGKEYKDATVSRVEPDGIVLKTKSGISKVYFLELPKEVQQRFNYEPQKAAAYSAEQAANYAATQNEQRKQLGQSQRQQGTAAQNIARVGQAESTINATYALEGRYAQIQNQKGGLQQRIREVKEPGVAYYVGRTLNHRPNPERVELPALESQLKDLEREEREVTQQLNQLKQAQH
jgi:hypothetical protein